MKKRRVTGYNKEKIAMIATSLVIVSACAVTGVYIHGKEKESAEEQIVDFAALEGETAKESQSTELASQDAVENKDMDLAMLDRDLDADPYYQETNSSSIINPSISANTASAENEQKTGEKRLAEDENGSKAEEEDDKNSQARGSEAGTAVTSEDEEETKSEKKESEETMASGSVFSEQSTLAWPVDGNVIMNYSMDKTVYFATLNQYQYNPALIIQSAVGTKVKAPTDAMVKEIGEDAKIGKFIVLDLGSGYELTLGQLENITIQEGSSVSMNQSLAEVSEPSRYYSVEGSNIYMKLEKNGKSVDPMQFLGQ